MVRHGETPWGVEGRYAGSSDVGLTDEGRRQAEAVGKWAAGAGLAAIWTSTLRRTIETAAPAAAALGLVPEADARLKELGFGEAEGRTVEEERLAHPKEVAAWDADPVGHPLPGGDDPTEAATAAVACLREIAARWPGGRVLVVTHGTLMRLCVCRLLGLPLSGYRRLLPVIPNAALTELALDGDEAALLCLNVPLAGG